MWLPEIGLWHYKARMYDPQQCRFLQTDPVGYEDQMNLYAYVGNDPVGRIDPTGQFGALAALAPYVPQLVAAFHATSVLAAQSAVGVAVTGAIAKLSSAAGQGYMTREDAQGRALSNSIVKNDNTSESSTTDGAEGGAARGAGKAKDRRAAEQARSREEKHGDPDYQEPASESYAKHKARQAEKATGKDARRTGHDAKGAGEPDRSRQQLDEDYER